MSISAMEITNADQAVAIIAWSRLWSPLVDDAVRTSAWQALDLTGSYQALKADYWSTFHAGAPQPPVSLLLHATLGHEGAGVREDWSRVASYLGLSWDNVHLPPDQLGAACEIYACAIQQVEPVLVNELRARYLLPWCQVAQQLLSSANSPMLPLVEQFRQDLEAIELAAP